MKSPGSVFGQTASPFIEKPFESDFERCCVCMSVGCSAVYCVRETRPSIRGLL